MAFKESRDMKVHEQSNYGYRSVPAIILRGKWLNELGFSKDTPINVKCENGRLIITVSEEKKNEHEQIQKLQRQRKDINCNPCQG